MRILLVSPFAQMSVKDVADGYHAAMRRAGHQVRVYDLHARLRYHDRAISEKVTGEARGRAISKQASETIAVEAGEFDADLVVIVSGLNIHPIALVLLHRFGIPTLVLHTESPYQDAQQAEWSAHHPGMAVATHEATSAARHGWIYAPHAYEPTVHYPRPVEAELRADVLIVGTGWPERIAFLEAIDWTGIDLRIYGLWPLRDTSPLRPSYHEGMVANADVPRLYSAAALCVNQYRGATGAVSLNPRAYELAACGACQVSESRAETGRVFGDAVPTFTTPAEAEAIIRDLLAHPEERRRLAGMARARVTNETFDARWASLLTAWRAGAGLPESSASDAGATDVAAVCG